MLITSLDNKKIKDYIKLKDKKYRDKKGLFIVEGMHSVLEALKCNLVEELILEENEILPFNAKIIYVTQDIIYKISNLDTPTNIMALCRKKEECEITDKVIVLDEIQDPGNLGTIIRSAVAFGFNTLVLGNNSVDLYNPKVVRATQGMIFHLNIIKRDLLEFIPSLKENNYLILGTKVTHGQNIKEVFLKDKMAIIMGNEGNGISDEILELCDKYCYIGMNEVCESLNIGVATSILMYEVFNGSNNGIY